MIHPVDARFTDHVRELHDSWPPQGWAEFHVSRSLQAKTQPVTEVPAECCPDQLLVQHGVDVSKLSSKEMTAFTMAYESALRFNAPAGQQGHVLDAAGAKDIITKTELYCLLRGAIPDNEDLKNRRIALKNGDTSYHYTTCNSYITSVEDPFGEHPVVNFRDPADGTARRYRLMTSTFDPEKPERGIVGKHGMKGMLFQEVDMQNRPINQDAILCFGGADMHMRHGDLKSIAETLITGSPNAQAHTTMAWMQKIAREGHLSGKKLTILAHSLGTGNALLASTMLRAEKDVLGCTVESTTLLDPFAPAVVQRRVEKALKLAPEFITEGVTSVLLWPRTAATSIDNLNHKNLGYMGGVGRQVMMIPNDIPLLTALYDQGVLQRQQQVVEGGRGERIRLEKPWHTTLVHFKNHFISEVRKAVDNPEKQPILIETVGNPEAQHKALFHGRTLHEKISRIVGAPLDNVADWFGKNRWQKGFEGFHKTAVESIEKAPQVVEKTIISPLPVIVPTVPVMPFSLAGKQR